MDYVQPIFLCCQLSREFHKSLAHAILIFMLKLFRNFLTNMCTCFSTIDGHHPIEKRLREMCALLCATNNEDTGNLLV